MLNNYGVIISSSEVNEGLHILRKTSYSHFLKNNSDFEDMGEFQTNSTLCEILNTLVVILCKQEHVEGGISIISENLLLLNKDKNITYISNGNCGLKIFNPNFGSSEIHPNTYCSIAQELLDDSRLDSMFRKYLPIAFKKN